MLVGLVRLEEVFVAKFLVAKLAVGLGIEDLNSAPCRHRRSASGGRGRWPRRRAGQPARAAIGGGLLSENEFSACSMVYCSGTGLASISSPNLLGFIMRFFYRSSE